MLKTTADSYIVCVEGGMPPPPVVVFEDGTMRVVSYGEWESAVETAEILGDAEAMRLLNDPADGMWTNWDDLKADLGL